MNPELYDKTYFWLFSWPVFAPELDSEEDQVVDQFQFYLTWINGKRFTSLKRPEVQSVKHLSLWGGRVNNKLYNKQVENAVVAQARDPFRDPFCSPGRFVFQAKNAKGGGGLAQVSSCWFFLAHYQ